MAAYRGHGIGNLVGALFGGIAQAKNQKLKREKDEEKNKLTQSLIKMQMDQTKLKMKQAEMVENQRQRRWDLLQEYNQRKAAKQQNPPQAGQTQTTPMGESMKRGKGDILLDLMMQGEEGRKSADTLSRIGRTVWREGAGPQGRPGSVGTTIHGDLTGQFIPKTEEWRKDIIGQPGGGEKTRLAPKYGPQPSLEWQSKPTKPKTAEVSGKLATIKDAIPIVDKVEGDLIIDGKVDRKRVFEMWSRFPYSKGREMKDDIMKALDAKIRAMTGAAITADEVPFYEKQYIPSPLDSDEQIKSKLKALKSFLQSSKEMMAPGENIVPQRKPGESIEDYIKRTK